MDDGAPSLEVGFAIETGGSFDELLRLQSIMTSTEAQVLVEAAKIEKATGGMVNLAGATASISSFGNAATRELQAAAREAANVEKAGERLVAQLERQIAAYGKTREEMRATKVEELALAAERVGNADLAMRLRAQEQVLWSQETAAAVRARQVAEAVAEDKAMAAQQAVAAAAAEEQAVRSAAQAYQMFEAAARKGMQALREQQAAEAATTRETQELATAAGRLKASIDPAVASQQRFDREMGEARRLISAGAISLDDYCAKLRMEKAALEETATAHGKNAFALKQTAMQLPDIIGGLLSGQKPMQVLIQQGSQIAQVGMMAEGGLKGFALQLGRVALAAAPLVAILGTVAAVAGGAFLQFRAQVKDSGELTRYRDGLGLTHAEMLKLSDGTDKAGDKIERLGKVTVTAGDVMSGIWKTIQQAQPDSSGAWDKVRSGASAALAWIIEAWNKTSAGITAGIYGTFSAVKTIWSSFPAVFGDLFVQGVNAAISALNSLVKAGVDQLNALIAAANKVPGVKIGAVSAPQIDPLANANAGAAAKAAKQIRDGYVSAYADARKADAAFWKQVGDNAIKSAKDRMKAEADALKAGRTPKSDRHAEELAREYKATEAQIAGLYRLATAYGVSSAAAIIAEAREKAEAAAIKKRADLETYVAQQVRLTVAQRVADGAKAVAALEAQTAVERRVNDEVASGVVSASRANDLVRDRMATLPLLAAAEAARLTGNKKGAEAAAAGLARLASAESQANAEKARAIILQAQAASRDDIERLQLEAKLIGASNLQRATQLAQLEAEQRLRGMSDVTPEQAAGLTKALVERAKAQEDLRAQQAQYNGDLRLAADLADSLGESLSRAFGRAGAAISDAVRILGHYGEQQENIAKAVRDRQITEEDGAKRLANLQLTSLIGLTDAAKGLFKEHSKGYQAMAAAEKALTVLQLARTAVDVAGGAAAMFKTLGPFAFPAVAAMLAVMASLGFSGGAAGSYKPTTNSGTGTVLGDDAAKSESVSRSIEQLKNVELSTNHYSAQMAASLQNIEQQLGGLSSLIVRTGGLDAAKAGIQTGTSVSGLGSAFFGVGSQLPLVGGLISGITKALFGTKTSIVGNGIFAGAQSLSDILSGGFDASYYADIEKKKKTFGITTSTKYSTQMTGADAELESQFSGVLRQFYEAIGAAAGPLGKSLDEVQGKLTGFVVDLGRIDLKGLTGQEIHDKLAAVFGAAGDDMARAAFGGLEKFQKVGEGYFETIVRVASSVEGMSNRLSLLGQAANLGVDATMGLVDSFGDIASALSATDDYFTKFYTDAEQSAAKTAQLQQALQGFGFQMPESVAAFRALVEAQDLTTDAGRAAYTTLIKLAPAFSDVFGSAQDAAEAAKSAADQAAQQAQQAADAETQRLAGIAQEREGLQRQYLQLIGDTATIRALDLATLDESNRGLQQNIWALQDQQAAQDAATKAAQDAAAAAQKIADDAAAAEAARLNERAGLQRQLLEAQGDSAAIRAMDLAALDESNRAIQQQVWALQDQAAAEAAATARANERAGLERQLLELQGDTVALRALDLAGLDGSNRALQQQIWALQDQQAAQDEVTKSAQQMRDAWMSIADNLLETAKKIRGEGAIGGGSFASLMAQFNAATTAARGGDQTAAGSLSGLSDAVLKAAQDIANDGADLARIQSQVAASLEQTASLIGGGSSPLLGLSGALSGVSQTSAPPPWWQSFIDDQVAGANASAADAGTVTELRALRQEVSDLRAEQRTAAATIASNTGRTSRILEAVAPDGDALEVRTAA